ncbi:MAG: carboxypeptidase-like regulatory domain-containing protein [Salinivirgaceae bacterium]|nr:carboxypeptidase-like regulatory domain-containing protein [Salinivirgaceae bacterium]
MKSYLICAFVVLSFQSYAQIQTLIIKGTVKGENNEIIENAHIYSSLYGKGTVSNENGIFLLKVSRSESKLVFTHVSYHPLEVSLSFKQVVDTLYLQVKLKTKSNIISEVDINENKKYLVVKADRIWVYDYLFMDEENMLLLLKDKNKYELRLINTVFGQIHNIIIKKGNKCFLEEDGLGKKYLCKNDSVFQVFINQQGIQLNFEGLYDKFNEMIGPIWIIRSKPCHSFR